MNKNVRYFVSYVLADGGGLGYNNIIINYDKEIEDEKDIDKLQTVIYKKLYPLGTPINHKPAIIKILYYKEMNTSNIITSVN